MTPNDGRKGSPVSNEWLDSLLIGHARGIHLAPGDMEACLSDMVTDPQVATLSEDGSGHGGCLSSLIADPVRVDYISFGEPVTLQLWNRNCFDCVLPLKGRARLEQYPGALQESNGPFFLHPKSDQHWQLSADCGLLVLSLCVDDGLNARITEVLAERRNSAELIRQARAMMAALPYRLHHGLNYGEKLRRLEQIHKEFLELVGFPSEHQAVNRDTQAMDPRIIRAMEHLQQLPPQSYDLDSVCEAAAMSRRALYYAFDRNLKCTPYAYFLACRLIRIRLALLHDSEARWSIAEHASAHGVQHVGRFAGYYRAQFGEQPSETRERVLFTAPARTRLHNGRKI